MAMVARIAAARRAGVAAAVRTFFSPGAMSVICGMLPSGGTSEPTERTMVRSSSS
jgi:hypothetical protein